MAQIRQKSYADKRRRPLKFKVEDFMMLKVTPMKGVKHFIKKEEFASMHIGPFRIIGRVGDVSYCLKVLDTLTKIHNVFHVSILRKHLRDEEQQQVMNLSKLQL